MLDQWETIRLRCVRDGEPIKVVARDLGLSKNTVRKYVRSLQAPEHPGIDRSCRLDVYRYHIDEWLHRSPRITAVRIGALLRERVDEDLQIGERAMRYYVANRRREIVAKAAFVRSLYTTGHEMQFDFTPVKVLLSGVLMIVQLFVARLSYSGKLFARVSLHADQPALFGGLLDAVVHFGGVPKVGVFDNAKIAVTKVLRGRSREENEVFRAFCGALALAVEFAAPAKGNEKGGVEGACGFVEATSFVRFPSMIALMRSTPTYFAFANVTKLGARRCIMKRSASGSSANGQRCDRYRWCCQQPACVASRASTNSLKSSTRRIVILFQVAGHFVTRSSKCSMSGYASSSAISALPNTGAA
jgi:transposase